MMKSTTIVVPVMMAMAMSDCDSDGEGGDGDGDDKDSSCIHMPSVLSTSATRMVSSTTITRTTTTPIDAMMTEPL